LARLRGTSRQNMQVLVDRLAHHGWVEYVVNPDHQRSERVRLTGTGEQTLRSTNQRHATRLAALLPHVSERSLRTCIGQLQRLHHLLLAQAGRRPLSHLIARERRSAGSRAGRVKSIAGEVSSASGRLRPKVTRVWTQDTTAPVSPEEVRPTEETIGVETLPVTLL